MSGIQFSGLASGLDTENIIKQLMKAENMKVDKVRKEKTKLEWTKDVWKEMNTKLYEFYTKEVFDLKSGGTFAKKKGVSSNPTAISVNSSNNSINGVHTISVTNLARGAYLNSEELTSDTVTLGSDIEFSLSDGVNTKSIELKAGATTTDFINAINNSGLNIKANYDTTNKRIFINSTKTGDKSDIIFSDIDALNTSDENIFFESLGLAVDSGMVKAEVLGEKGQNAEYTYNGVVGLTSESNDIDINGLKLRFNSKATDVTINITQDTDEIYNKVKNFITKYNSIMTEINEKIGAESTRGYEPLTTEEKKAMSDDEVKLWEEKIKKSLLRRDSTLTTLANSMRSIVGSSSGVDTKDFKYDYLSDLGIVTGRYTEKGFLHIDGDEEDALYASKENKLKKAIEDDPDKVAELFNAIGQKVYSTMQSKMKSTSLSSALTFFNDKNMDKKVTEYKERIYTMEDRLEVVENRYYRQFTAMEKAIQMMNNQSASLASMLGGGA